MCDSKMFPPVVQQKKPQPPVRAKREAATDAPAAAPSANATTQGPADRDASSNQCQDVKLDLQKTRNNKGELFFNTRC